MSIEQYAFNFVILREDDGWTAQCLQYDIATQATTLTDILYEIQKLIVSHFAVAEDEGRRPFEGIGTAPQKYWDLFARAQVTLEREQVPFRVADVSPQFPKPHVRLVEPAALHA